MEGGAFAFKDNAPKQAGGLGFVAAKQILYNLYRIFYDRAKTPARDPTYAEVYKELSDFIGGQQTYIRLNSVLHGIPPAGKRTTDDIKEGPVLGKLGISRETGLGIGTLPSLSGNKYLREHLTVAFYCSDNQCFIVLGNWGYNYSYYHFSMPKPPNTDVHYKEDVGASNSRTNPPKYTQFHRFDVDATSSTGTIVHSNLLKYEGDALTPPPSAPAPSAPALSAPALSAPAPSEPVPTNKAPQPKQAPAPSEPAPTNKPPQLSSATTGATPLTSILPLHKALAARIEEIQGTTQGNPQSSNSSAQQTQNSQPSQTAPTRTSLRIAQQQKQAPPPSSSTQGTAQGNAQSNEKGWIVSTGKKNKGRGRSTQRRRRALRKTRKAYI